MLSLAWLKNSAKLDRPSKGHLRAILLLKGLDKRRTKSKETQRSNQRHSNKPPKRSRFYFYTLDSISTQSLGHHLSMFPSYVQPQKNHYGHHVFLWRCTVRLKQSCSCSQEANSAWANLELQRSTMYKFGVRLDSIGWRQAELSTRACCCS